RFSREYRSAGQHPRNAAVIERQVLRQVMAVGERQFLMRRLHGGHAVVLEIERRAVLRILGIDLPAAKVEARGHAGVPVQADLGIAVHSESALPPRAGYDQGLDEVALHTVIVGGLMVLIEQSEWHQEQSGLDRGPWGELVIDVELLDLELAYIVRR